MTNMLKGLRESRQHVRTDEQCKQSKGKPKKESKWNARRKKKNTVTEMKHAFDRLFSKVDTAEKFFWTGESINRIVKNQKQSEQKLKEKKRTEYSQIVEQITKGIIRIKWEY